MKKNRKPKLTRAELNELSWQQKKTKKKSVGNKRGSRANPEAAPKTVKTAIQEVAKKQEVHAIPIYLPSKGKVVVAENLTRIDEVVKETEAPTPVAKTNTVVSDLVVKHGNLISSAPAPKGKSQSKATNNSVNKAPVKTPVKDQANVDAQGTIHLGKAVLRRLEKLGVPPGQELAFLEQERQERHLRRKERNGKVSANDNDQQPDVKRTKTRDYKAGRNTDYVSSQAMAEKQLGKRKTKRTAEELYADWENTAW